MELDVENRGDRWKEQSCSTASVDLAQTARAPLSDEAQVKALLTVVSDDPFGLEVFLQDGQQFVNTFSLTTPSAERERPVGQPCRFREHKQGSSGKKAVHAG